MSLQKNEADYVWRFRLEAADAQPILADPLLELIRVQWEELLKLSRPTFRGQPVQVDGFATLRDLDTVHPIFPPEEP